MSEVFFIDKKGNKISCDKVNSHIGLANIVMENDEKLKQEFQRSGKQNPVETLLLGTSARRSSLQAAMLSKMQHHAA